MKQVHTLEGDSLHFSYGTRKILSGVYLKIETGKVTGLLGRNGSGKSTLLNLLFGVATSQNGTVRWNSAYVTRPFQVPKLVTYMPQKPCVPGRLTFAKAAALLGIKQPEAASLLSVSQMEKLADTPLGLASTGERKLLEALLFLGSARHFVLLDEPFSFLSPLQVSLLKPLIISKSQEKGILVTDHRYEDVLEISNNTYLLRDTSICQIADREELRRLGYIS